MSTKSSPEIDLAFQQAVGGGEIPEDGVVSAPADNEATRELDTAGQAGVDEFAHNTPTGQYGREHYLALTARGGIKPRVASDAVREIGEKT